MIEQVLALQIIIPLISAVLCSLANYKRFAWLITFCATIAVLVCSIVTSIDVYNHGPLLYAMGGWPAPYGIELRLDLLNALFTLLIAGMMTITLPYCLYTTEEEVSHKKQGAFYSCLLLCLAGFMGMVITNDIFNIYVFLELSSLATYALLAMGNKGAAKAAFDYLIIGTVAATFYLFGIGLLYMITGTLNISDLASKIISIERHPILNAAMIFIFIGMAIKAALFPFYHWMVNAYSSAPNYIAVIFSATATKVAIYLMIRFIYSLFYNIPFLYIITHCLWLLSLFAIVIAAFGAARSAQLSRLLPYSSASQLGYIILGISLLSKSALAAALLHIIFHSITKAGLFMLDRLLAKNIINPLVKITFIILGCSLIGLPITAGFISKWYLAMATIAQQDYISLMAIIIGSLITAFYIWKNIEIILFSTNQALNRQHAVLLVPLSVLTILILMGGIYSAPLLDLINLAVKDLYIISMH